VVSRWFQRHGCDGVHDGLIIGAMPRDADDVAVLLGHGVSRVINLAHDAEYDGEEYSAALRAYLDHGIPQARVLCRRADAGDAVEERHAPRLAPQHLREVTALTAAALRERRTVYLHSGTGHDRCVVTGAAAISRATGQHPLTSLRTVMALRRGADPDPHAITTLLHWWSHDA
jgi:hypothetical protein